MPPCCRCTAVAFACVIAIVSISPGLCLGLSHCHNGTHSRDHNKIDKCPSSPPEASRTETSQPTDKPAMDLSRRLCSIPCSPLVPESPSASAKQTSVFPMSPRQTSTRVAPTAKSTSLASTSIRQTPVDDTFAFPLIPPHSLAFHDPKMLDLRFLLGAVKSSPSLQATVVARLLRPCISSLLRARHPPSPPPGHILQARRNSSS